MIFVRYESANRKCMGHVQAINWTFLVQIIDHSINIYFRSYNYNQFNFNNKKRIKKRIHNKIMTLENMENN